MKKGIIALGLTTFLSACGSSDYKGAAEDIISKKLGLESIDFNELYTVPILSAGQVESENIAICGRFTHNGNTEYDNRRFVIAGPLSDIGEGKYVQTAFLMDSMSTSPAMLSKSETSFEYTYWNKLCVDDSHPPQETAKPVRRNSMGSGWTS